MNFSTTMQNYTYSLQNDILIEISHRQILLSVQYAKLSLKYTQAQKDHFNRKPTFPVFYLNFWCHLSECLFCEDLDK